MGESKREQKSAWVKTPVANLLRYHSSGVYFARVRVAGKLIRQSLKTNVFSVAKIRLADLTQDQRKAAEAGQASANGKMSFAEARKIYEERLANNQRLKPTAKLYRMRTIKDLCKSWPDINGMDIRKVTERQCLEWSAKFATKYSPTVYNNTVGTLRHILEVGIRAGARYGNPANTIPKLKVRQKVLKLPEQKQFIHMVEAIRSAGGRFSNGCADLTEFLAYSGCRKGEATRVHGRHCSFEKGEISIFGDPATGTKNWGIRRVPMIPDMRRLLERIRSERGEEEWMGTTVMQVRECQKAIDSACKKLGLTRITHHDLRHLFATRCIESGVDIPTVSRWLGHKDGGALAMKTYGHLRDQHSAAMAQKVTFADSPSSQS